MLIIKALLKIHQTTLASLKRLQDFYHKKVLAAKDQHEAIDEDALNAQNTAREDRERLIRIANNSHYNKIASIHEVAGKERAKVDLKLTENINAMGAIEAALNH
ncbi:MAG: hypothetical protein COC24_013315 [Alphaproteobacteria bacterium]|nr:hypothetical protein [Alphaproteobacteria bacterium]